MAVIRKPHRSRRKTEAAQDTKTKIVGNVVIGGPLLKKWASRWVLFVHATHVDRPRRCIICARGARAGDAERVVCFYDLTHTPGSAGQKGLTEGFFFFSFHLMLRDVSPRISSLTPFPLDRWSHFGHPKAQIRFIVVNHPATSDAPASPLLHVPLRGWSRRWMTVIAFS